MVARTIQLIIAPAVMINSCCIFGAGLLGHYSSIGERLPVTVHESASNAQHKVQNVHLHGRTDSLQNARFHPCIDFPHRSRLASVHTFREKAFQQDTRRMS